MPVVVDGSSPYIIADFAVPSKDKTPLTVVAPASVFNRRLEN
jgi:hypothetical protein